MGTSIMNAIGSIDWYSESFPIYQDFVVVPLFAIFFPTVRFVLDRFVFEGVAKRSIFGKGNLKQASTEDGRKRINKFKESAWKCIYFLSAEVLALLVTYDEPWFTNTRSFWLGPGDQLWPDLLMKMKLKGLYMYAAGFYAYSIFALIFWETRRKDFGVSMGHHVATFVLIVLSYMVVYLYMSTFAIAFLFIIGRELAFVPGLHPVLCGALYSCLGRVGSVVLALHDASDVFIEIGKMSKYSGYETVASISFVLFVISWIILRLIYYPFWVLWSTSYEVIQIMDHEKHRVDGPIKYYFFNTLLFGLLVLHIYWWVLMYRMLVKQIQSRGKVGDDVRSDSEGEDEHED